METQTFTFASSQYVPIAIGFFGLATGYFIWGGQALFGFPKTSPEVNRTMGLWGFWMPGFMQFITGVYLLIGLTWFNVFGKPSRMVGKPASSDLYFAASNSWCSRRNSTGVTRASGQA